MATILSRALLYQTDSYERLAHKQLQQLHPHSSKVNAATFPWHSTARWTPPKENPPKRRTEQQKMSFGLELLIKSRKIKDVPCFSSPHFFGCFIVFSLASSAACPHPSLVTRFGAVGSSLPCCFPSSPLKIHRCWLERLAVDATDRLSNLKKGSVEAKMSSVHVN